jgi:hypothetical protein
MFWVLLKAFLKISQGFLLQFRMNFEDFLSLTSSIVNHWTILVRIFLGFLIRWSIISERKEELF